MAWEAWLTLIVIVAVIAVMVRDLLPPAGAVLGGTIVLLLANVIESQAAFAGFSNQATLTVAVLYVLAAAASRTGLARPLIGATLGEGPERRGGLGRLMAVVAGASSVLNNTPIVAVLVPEVSSWAARHDRASSRFLMPLSFAAILGGLVTLIGTSTNLVVSGLLEEFGQEPIGFFEITKVGLPIALGGLALLAGLARRLLPDRRSTREEILEEARQFIVDMEVQPAGPLEGRAVGEAGLRHLAGVFLVQIERGTDTIAPVAPHTVLRGGDVLRFAGRADDIVDLLAMPGLTPGAADQFEGFDLARSSFFELVVGASSRLVGSTLRESRFRSTYQAAVVAIHRAGQLVDAKLGDVALRVGDTLIVLADPAFRERWRDRREFLLVSPMGPSPAPDAGKRTPASLVIVGVVVLAATGALPVLHAVLAGAVTVVALRILTPGQARNAVDIDVVLLMAGGFGLAAAMESSGLALEIAQLFIDGLGALGATGALAGIVVATIVLTELVSNTAAAVIVFPIAVATAAGLGSDPRGFAIAVAVAASASFLTPVGYQTNTMVYGPGGYRYTDYARLGVFLTTLVLISTVLLVPLYWTI